MDQDVEDDEELISSLEKYMRHKRLVDWPVTFEENIELSSFISYNSSNDTFNFLKENVPFPYNIHTSISNDIEELWSKIKQHEFIMSQVLRKEDKLLDNSNKYNPYVERARKILNEKSKIVSRSLDINDCDYPGLHEVQVTGIPGLPDALQHLDRVSEAQGFNPGFLKIWRPFFSSAVSVAMFQDTFWWFFLHQFKPSAEEEKRLFDRIAEIFVSLFITVQRDLKDKLFMVYADCLAQAVYAAFYIAFPASLQQLNSDFKRHLTDCISFWVSGMKPKLLSWQNWNLDWLSSQGTREIKVESTWDQQEVFDEVVSSIRKMNVATPLSSSARGAVVATPLSSSARGAVVATPLSSSTRGAVVATPLSSWARGAVVATPLSSSARGAVVATPLSSSARGAVVATPLPSFTQGCSVATPLPSSARGSSMVEANIKKKESILVGPGPQFQHVPFMLCGPSPLMLHYLQRHSIPAPPAYNTRRIQRTEISSLPHPTYLEVGKEVQARSHRLHQEYKMNFKKTKGELADIQRERTLRTQEARRLMKEILSNPVEVKITSEAVINKWDKPSHKQRVQTGEDAGKTTEEDRNLDQTPSGAEDCEWAGQ